MLLPKYLLHGCGVYTYTKFSLEKANQEIKKFSLRVVSTAVADMIVFSITYMYVLLI